MVEVTTSRLFQRQADERKKWVNERTSGCSSMWCGASFFFFFSFWIFRLVFVLFFSLPWSNEEVLSRAQAEQDEKGEKKKKKASR